MRNRGTVYKEIAIVIAVIVIFLLFKTVGTTTVSDDSAGLDENGYPVAGITLDEPV